MTLDNQKKGFWFTALWPLWPFHLVQNEAASCTSMADTNIQDKTRFMRTRYTSLPIPQGYFQNNSDFAKFRRFVLLFPRFTFEDGKYEPCNFLHPISIDSFQNASRELEKRLDSPAGKCHIPVRKCKQCVTSLFTVIPQKLDSKGLFVSEFLMNLQSDKNSPHGFKCRDNNNIYTKSTTFQKWEKNSMLWLAGERLFQADQIWWGRFGLEILKEGGLVTPRGRETKVVLVSVSFFYDRSPDLVAAFFIDPQCSPEPAKHLLGLTYAMKEARKAWLFDWVGRLADTIMKMEDPKDFEFLGRYRHLEKRYNEYDKLFSKSPDRATRLLRVTYAREALEWMARVLAFFEASPEYAVSDRSVETFLDYDAFDSIAISKALREMDAPGQNKTCPWRPFLSKKDPQGDNFQRSRARLLFIREFLEESASTINSALEVKGVVKIKGSKAAKLMADLVRHVRLNPLTGKILLLGAPGGGKGLTAKRYHELAIEEIKKNESLLKETIEGVWDSLINILTLPKAQEAVDDQETDSGPRANKLLGFVKAQLQGTTWWRWSVLRDSDKDCDPPGWPCGETASCTKVSRNKKHNKIMELGDEPCETCPLEPYLKDLVESIPPNVASNAAIDPSVKFMAHYLARLLYAVYGIENDAGPETSHNFVQVLCGVLAEQGPEFISSMRRLFGTAEHVDMHMPIPGLFQTASYMAGTVFLDEIADAPVKVQDNLLGPLEEKKVSRFGWESIKEDVGNIRIVAATHKDLRALVRRYDDTKDSPKPQGFRPDLLSRLIIFPPVYPSSVTEYFLYDNDEERKIYQMDFISIMLEILKKAKDVKHPDDDGRRRFLQNLYDTIDGYIERTIRMMDFPKSQLSEIKKDLASKITTRLFVGILEEVAIAEKQAEHFAQAQSRGNSKQKQDDKKVRGDKNKGPDFGAIVREALKLQEMALEPSSLEKALKNFCQQTEDRITKTIKDLGIPTDKKARFKKDLLDSYNKTIEAMKKPADLPEPGKVFLNARLSDILAINLPKLLNYIINPEV